MAEPAALRWRGATVLTWLVAGAVLLPLAPGVEERGDLDESDVRLSKYDIIVCTSEKAESLLRHGLHWLDKIKVLVIDEIHLIHDPARGPTLEVIIAQIKALNPTTQLIALSATIKNAVELADWLGGKLIQSDWRPVVLREGVFFHNMIKFNDSSTKKITGDAKQALELLVADSLKDRGQSLIFVNNRKSTVSLAARLSGVVADLLSEAEKKDLKKFPSVRRSAGCRKDRRRTAIISTGFAKRQPND